MLSMTKRDTHDGKGLADAKPNWVICSIHLAINLLNQTLLAQSHHTTTHLLM